MRQVDAAVLSRQTASASPGVSTPSTGVRRDEHASGEDRRRHRGLGRVVEVLQGADQRRERVRRRVSITAGRRPRHPRLAGLGVPPAGGSQREAVDRPVAGGVRV